MNIVTMNRIRPIIFLLLSVFHVLGFSGSTEAGLFKSLVENHKGAVEKDIQETISEARMLANESRYDEALRLLFDANKKEQRTRLLLKILEDHQEFLVENPYKMPAGICPSAWADIRTYIIALASGSSFPFMKKDNSILASCSDLFRPVIFLIERIE